MVHPCDLHAHRKHSNIGSSERATDIRNKKAVSWGLSSERFQRWSDCQFTIHAPCRWGRWILHSTQGGGGLLSKGRVRFEESLPYLRTFQPFSETPFFLLVPQNRNVDGVRLSATGNITRQIQPLGRKFQVMSSCQEEESKLS